MNKIPFIIFVCLAALFAVSLLKGKNPAEVESVMIGRAVPVFDLPAAVEGKKGLSSKGLGIAPSIVNVFASWCLSCRVEQGILEEIAKAEKVAVYGLAYKDTPALLARWLKKYGNPYRAIGDDRNGQVAIDWGVYGVPETFIVDAEGIIRYKHVGPVTPDIYRTVFKPLLAELKK